MKLIDAFRALPTPLRQKICDDVDVLVCDHFPVVVLIREVPKSQALRKDRVLRSKTLLTELACETIEDGLEGDGDDAWWRIPSIDELVENWDRLLYEIGRKAIFNVEVILPKVLVAYREAGRLERLRTRALGLLAQLDEAEISAGLRQESGRDDRRMPSVFKEIRALAMLYGKPNDISLWYTLYAAEVLGEQSVPAVGAKLHLLHEPITEEVARFRRAYAETPARIGHEVDNAIARFHATVLPNLKEKYSAFRATRLAAE